VTLEERLAALRESGTNLLHHRRVIIDRVRSSLAQLRSHRSQLSEAITATATAPAPPDESLAQLFGFTLREAEVALLLAAGHSNADIARLLDISPHTARHHTQHVFAKLGVRSRAEAGAVIHRALGRRIPPR
jgi:DNA-binding CsgD family transcriptional regulator